MRYSARQHKAVCHQQVMVEYVDHQVLKNQSQLLYNFSLVFDIYPCHSKIQHNYHTKERLTGTHPNFEAILLNITRFCATKL